MIQYLAIIILSLAGMSTCKVQEQPKEEPVITAQEKITKKGTYPVDEYTKANDLGSYGTAVFAGGCFWCTEAAFERINGVVDVISGYAGGEKEYPTYGEVGSGRTKHAEAIYIYFDPEVISYAQLLEIFMVAHDPTTLNYQGPDYGPQYRSAIFYKTEQEKMLIDEAIRQTNASDRYDNDVVTQVTPYTEFWVAEKYHQNYYELNPTQSYVVNVSRPKVEKVKKTFPDLLKPKYKK